MNWTESGLRQAILRRPGDTADRLVYADWLEENGRDGRAECIRRGIAADDSGSIAQLHAHEWDEVREFAWKVAGSCQPEWCYSGFGCGLGWGWRNGFIETISCTVREWEIFGPIMVGLQPITQLLLYDRTQACGIYEGRIGEQAMWSGVPCSRDRPNPNLACLYNGCIHVPHTWVRRMRHRGVMISLDNEAFRNYPLARIAHDPGDPKRAERILNFGAINWARRRAKLPSLPLEHVRA